MKKILRTFSLFLSVYHGDLHFYFCCHYLSILTYTVTCESITGYSDAQCKHIDRVNEEEERGGKFSISFSSLIFNCASHTTSWHRGEWNVECVMYISCVLDENRWISSLPVQLVNALWVTLLHRQLSLSLPFDQQLNQHFLSLSPSHLCLEGNHTSIHCGMSGVNCVHSLC